MNNGSQITHLLKLTLKPSDDSEKLISDLEKAGAEGRAKFLSLADSHHVILRALDPLSEAARSNGNLKIADWCEETLSHERVKVFNSLKFLSKICRKLEDGGIQVTVMKSLDHWPDIGNDLDLYTPGDRQDVSRAMMQCFDAHLKHRTWGDRLAQKCNFGVEGLRKSVEIHHGCLGQTGEHIEMAKRFYTRRVSRQIGDYTFMLPAPEEKIIAATLQRMYRHLYIRVCDIVNTHSILESGELNFEELQFASDLGGIWPGVATYLRVVTELVHKFRGSAYRLDPQVIKASRFGIDQVFVRGIWLRIPVRHAAMLYSRQVFQMATRRDLHGVLRLSLLPPLASVARLSYVLTGNPSGIW